MKSPKMSRRTALKGAGSISIALPFLEIMGADKAYAATKGKRFISVFTPGGTVLNNWRPSGDGANFTLSQILSPLESVKDKILVLDGLAMKVANGEQHQCGNVALLTGTAQSDSPKGFAAGPSLDQVLAAKLSEGKRFQSLQMAIRWATGTTHGKTHPANIINFENNANFNPIPPQIDPQEIWQSIFGKIGMDGSLDAASQQALLRQKSILDYLGKSYQTLSAKLGANDKRTLDQHLTKIREMEKSLEAESKGVGARCKAPMRVDTSDYNPQTGLNSDNTGSVVDSSTDKAIPKVGKFMMDMLVMALSCDLTGVATLQWTDTEAKHTFPWLNLVNHHHYYQHDGGFRPEELTQIYRWYASQHAYLINALKEVSMGEGTLLDETVIFFGSELQEPPSHSKENMPFLLAGNGGGLKTGRYLKFPGVSHNNLLLTLLHLFGDERKSFGKSEFTSGTLPGLV